MNWYGPPKGSPCTCCPGGVICVCCDPTTWPSSFLLTMSGWANISTTPDYCADCTPHNNSLVIPTITSCVAARNDNPGKCGGLEDIYQIAMHCEGDNNYLELFFRMGGTVVFQDFTWRKDFGSSPPDCTSWSGLTMDFFGKGGTPLCDETGTTIQITSQ